MIIKITAIVRFMVNCLLMSCALSGCVQAFGMAHPVTVAGATENAAPIVTAVNLSASGLQNVPVTFGQPFRDGDIPVGDTVAAFLNGQALPTQTDIKARNPDGSVRHAILTVLLPALSGSSSETLTLQPSPGSLAVRRKNLTLEDLLQTRFDAAIDLDIVGQPWRLDARALLQRAAHDKACQPYGSECKLWMSGPLVSAWIVGGPLRNPRAEPHPHLAVWFAIRAYGPAPVNRVRVDVIVENDWAYAPAPQNITYNATVSVGGQTAYTVSDLTQYRQSRWHRVFWWGAPDPVYAKLDFAYLQASMAVPRYENLPAPASLLSTAIQTCAPMQPCNQTPTMANTGAQASIGPLPRWTSVYVIHPTYQAFRWMLANDDALGAYSVHFRDRVTGRSISIAEHPCATLVKPAEVVKCEVAPYADDRFPTCPQTAQCQSPLSADESHHPAPAYVAYLVTGDWYYLEELTDWSVWVSLTQNPTYRNYSDGLLSHDQERGQAWGLRTLGYAAYILPDDDPFKNRFNHVVDSNIQWYNRTYTDSPDANKLGIITNGYTVVYSLHGQDNNGIAPWQNSFFVWSVGNLKDLGFHGADELLKWVAKFPLDLMTSPDFCWTEASAYQLQVRDTQTSPIYDSVGEVYAKSFPELQGVACDTPKMWAIMNKNSADRYGEDAMVGYPDSPTGFPANFQIGLVAAVDSGLPQASKAWMTFMHRKVRPNYAETPQFALVPRKFANGFADN